MNEVIELHNEDDDGPHYCIMSVCGPPDTHPDYGVYFNCVSEHSDSTLICLKDAQLKELMSYLLTYLKQRKEGA